MAWSMEAHIAGPCFLIIPQLLTPCLELLLDTRHIHVASVKPLSNIHHHINICIGMIFISMSVASKLPDLSRGELNHPLYAAMI